MSETATAIHSHVCMKCAEQKKNVVWMHGDDNAGVIGLHTCPECGTINWRKVILPPAELPKAKNVQKINYEALLGYIVLAVGLALLGYGAFLYVRKWQDGKASISNSAE